MFLKLSRIILRRSLAKKFCDAGKIVVNDRVARSSHNVRPGDIIEADFPGEIRKFRVELIPGSKNVSRSKAGELATLIHSKRKDIFN